MYSNRVATILHYTNDIALPGESSLHSLLQVFLSFVCEAENIYSIVATLFFFVEREIFSGGVLWLIYLICKGDSVKATSYYRTWDVLLWTGKNQSSKTTGSLICEEKDITSDNRKQLATTRISNDLAMTCIRMKNRNCQN